MSEKKFNLSQTGAQVQEILNSAKSTDQVLTDIQEAMENLPDGQAVSAQVALNTAAIQELDANKASKTEVVFDISAYHATGGVLAEYADLTAALGANGANIPDALRKGGMSVKFVQSSDNKYVQFRLMAQNFTTDVTQWQSVDDEPIIGSNNLSNSDGVAIDIHKNIDGVVSWLKEQSINIHVNTPIEGKRITGRASGKLIFADDENEFYCLITPNKLIKSISLKLPDESFNGQIVCFGVNNNNWSVNVARNGILSNYYPTLISYTTGNSYFDINIENVISAGYGIIAYSNFISVVSDFLIREVPCDILIKQQLDDTNTLEIKVATYSKAAAIASGKIQAVGDKYYNISTKDICECVSYTNSTTMTFKDVKKVSRNQLYILDGEVYRYNGTTLVKATLPLETSLNQQFEDIKSKDHGLVGIERFRPNYLSKFDLSNLQVYTGKRISGYNTTTKLPILANSDNTVVLDFTLASLVAKGITNFIVSKVENASTQLICYYTENTGASIVDNDNVTTEEYTTIDGKLLSFERIAICFNSDNVYIKFKQDCSNRVQKDVVKFITHDELQDNSVDKDKIIANYAPILDSNIINESVIKHRRSAGYTSHIPNWTNDANCAQVFIPIEKGNGYLIDWADNILKGQSYILDKDYKVIRNLTDTTLLNDPTERSLYGFSFVNDNKQLAFNPNQCLIYKPNAAYYSFTFDLTVNKYPRIESVGQFIPEWLNTDKLEDVVLGKTVDIILPEKVVVCAGREMNFYHNTFVRYFNTDKCPIRSISNLNNYEKFARISPSNDDTGSETTIRANYAFGYDHTNIFKEATLKVIPKNSGNGLSKKILLIGDSLTDADVYPTELVNLFSDDVMSVEFIGTRDTQGTPNEGFSGWRAFTFATCANGTDDNASAGVNPFYNPSTQEFDFSYYMTQNGFTGVDYVFICLGTNDVAKGNHKDDMTDYWDIMINSIKAYNPNVRIGLWMPPTRALMANTSKSAIDGCLMAHKNLLTTYSGRENENLYLVPVYLNVDPEHDYTYTEQPVSNRNNQFTMRVCSDDVHPAVYGYNKIADVMYSYIKYFGSLDE